VATVPPVWIRVDLPDPVHRELKSRAALDGVSLRDYIVRVLSEHAEAPKKKPRK
jgi:predicted HicB family RNase H-like nuclease